jgi:hypothetical protein
MTLGYILIGQDNDSFMFDNEVNPDADKCSSCGYIIDFDYYNPFFKVKRRVYDLSHPYDIGTIVSLRFKEFCERNSYLGLRFKSFERDPDFFQLHADNIIHLAPGKRGTTFTDYCTTCKNYKEVIGATPSFLMIEKEIEDGIYRSDLLFGSGNRKGSILLTGNKTKDKLEKEKMKGLTFIPVYGYDFWSKEIKPKLKVR